LRQAAVKGEANEKRAFHRLLLLKAEEKDGKISIFVGGKSISMAQGEFG
jgi:hypothetical protein